MGLITKVRGTQIHTIFAATQLISCPWKRQSRIHFTSESYAVCLTLHLDSFNHLQNTPPKSGHCIYLYSARVWVGFILPKHQSAYNASKASQVTLD